MNRHGYCARHNNDNDSDNVVKKHNRNKVKKKDIRNIVCYYTSNGNDQDVSYGYFECELDDNNLFIVPSWIRSMNRDKSHKKCEAEFEEKSFSRSYFLKVSLGIVLPHMSFLFILGLKTNIQKGSKVFCRIEQN